MNIKDLQQKLKDTKRLFGPVDGAYGPATKGAVMLALTDGPDTKLVEQDFVDSANRLGVTPAHIKMITLVESAGAGFSEGRPVLLFEPHRFSKATKGNFDGIAPDVSYPKWDKSKYPRSQGARYEQLLKAITFDVDAAFASASYGRFQVLGENAGLCGFKTSFDFAVAHAYDEKSQLQAFENFLKNRGLVKFMKTNDFDSLAIGYNGTAARENQYPQKLQKAFIQSGGRL